MGKRRLLLGTGGLLIAEGLWVLGGEAPPGPRPWVRPEPELLGVLFLLGEGVWRQEVLAERRGNIWRKLTGIQPQIRGGQSSRPDFRETQPGRWEVERHPVRSSGLTLWGPPPPIRNLLPLQAWRMGTAHTRGSGSPVSPASHCWPVWGECDQIRVRSPTPLSGREPQFKRRNGKLWKPTTLVMRDGEGQISFHWTAVK